MAASLEAGTSVSRYSIVGPIGAGGMGEVYKAQDSALDRMVALKILPPAVVKNDERRRRFVQEARSASSLNHPHIVTIHDIGEVTLEPSGQLIHYIAMELIDGMTLKRKIHQEQSDLRTIVGFLAQAADGLAKAHAAGIIHRDLKPENIMVTRDGFAKVLDFGLAKLIVRKSASETTEGATAVMNDTREGAILGTVAYMAPEQVMGKVVDHRCDIFSFGTILYEAATRRRPFEADSDVDVMHKILHDAPPPIEPAARVPAELRRIIRRCLAKDPERRYQSMKDLAIDLRDLVDNYEELSVSATSGSSTNVAVAAPPKRNSALWIAAAVAAVAIVALTVVLVQQRRKPASAGAPAAMSIQRLTSSGNVSNAKISRDGRYLAMVVRDRDGAYSLRVRQIATGSEVELAPPSMRQIAGLAFTPDGNYVYYAQRDEAQGTVGWLYQVPTLGGVSRKIAFNVDTAPSFSPDGKQLAFGRGMPEKQENHYLVGNADGSGLRVVASLPRFGQAVSAPPDFSPDGKKLLAARPLPPAGALSSAIEIDLATGAVRDIPSAPWWWIYHGAWLPDGRGWILTAIRKGENRAQLWLQPLAGGEPRRLTSDFNDYRATSVTADGKTLVAGAIEVEGDLHEAALSDASGGKPVESERSLRVVELATSASSGAAVYTRNDDAASNLFILDAPGAQPRALTTGGFNGGPSISADGRTIVYTVWDGDQPHIWTVDPEGTNARQITTGEGESWSEISPDGKLLQYVSGDALWRRPFAGGTPVKVVDRPTGVHGFSSDSRLVFYRYWMPTESKIALRVEPVAGGKPIMDIPSRGGREFRFTPNGEGIAYVLGSGGADNLLLQKLDGSEPVPLTRFTRGGIESFGWRPDGKIVYVRTTRRSDVVMFTGF